MATYPPVPPVPPPGYDPRDQRRFLRDQARAQRAAFRAHRDQMRYQMRGYRRASVLGPIALIVIGILFLLVQTGRLNHDSFWGWYGHWWPMLLVGAGLIVLAEWAFDQFHLRDPQHPPYRRSIGGLAFLLVIFMVVTGVLASNGINFHSTQSNWFFPAFKMDADSLDELFGDKRESDQNVDLAFASGGSLNVVNPRGDVSISGTSDDGRVHIAIHKEIYSRSDSDADSRAQQLSPAINNDSFGVSLKMPVLDGARGDLVITVPAGAATTVNAGHGDIHVASIKAPVAVTANHGDIELAAITGAATAHINNSGSSITARSIDGALSIQCRAQDVTLSDISGEVTVNGDVFGTAHLEHIRGPIHYHTSRTDVQFARLDGETEISGSGISADQALGPAVLATSNRNITLERIAGDLSVTDRNGTIELTAAPNAGGQLGNITLEDRNGSIRTTLPEHASFTVQAGTSNGNIDNDFQLSTSVRGNPSRDDDDSDHDDKKTVNGSVGAGGPLVRITTTNADISLRKADVPPLAPLAPASPTITLVPTPPTPPATPHVKKHQAAAAAAQ